MLIAVIALLSTQNAAAADDAITAVDPEEQAKVCIDTARIRNHDPLSDRHLFIEQSGKTYFLLTMRSNCFGMRNARVIAFKDTLRRICSTDNFAEVMFRDAGRSMSCRIANIEAVADKDSARALIAERDQPAPDAKQED